MLRVLYVFKGQVLNTALVFTSRYLYTCISFDQLSTLANQTQALKLSLQKMKDYQRISLGAV